MANFTNDPSMGEKMNVGHPFEPEPSFWDKASGEQDSHQAKWDENQWSQRAHRPKHKMKPTDEYFG